MRTYRHVEIAVGSGGLAYLSRNACSSVVVSSLATVTTLFPHGLLAGDILPDPVRVNSGLTGWDGLVSSVTSTTEFTAVCTNPDETVAGEILQDLPYKMITFFGVQSDGSENAGNVELVPRGSAPGGFSIKLIPSTTSQSNPISDTRPVGVEGFLGDWIISGAEGDGVAILIDQ